MIEDAVSSVVGHNRGLARFVTKAALTTVGLTAGVYVAKVNAKSKIRVEEGDKVEVEDEERGREEGGCGGWGACCLRGAES